MERDRRLGAVNRLGLLASIVWAAACSPASPAGPKLAPTSSRCPAAFEEGPKGTCFSLPSAPDARTATVLYVHSASNEAVIAQELELVKATFGEHMGVLFARGSESECALSADVHATFCWPQPDDAATSEAIWERWDKVQWQAEALLPEGTHPRLVIGFREGAAFAAQAFKRGMIHAQLVAVVAPAEGALRPGPYPGWLVGVGAPPSSEPIFTSPNVTSARCPREDSRQLVASDLAHLGELFQLATDRARTGDPAPCTIHDPASAASASPPAGTAP